MHIGAGRELADPRAPIGEDLVALARIAAEPDRAADMVEHDRRLGKGARQIDQVAELGWYIQASKLRPSGASRAKPSRTRPSAAGLGR